MIGSVQFPNGEMYEAFKNKTVNRDEVKSFVFYDDNNLNIWIMWYEKELIK